MGNTPPLKPTTWMSPPTLLDTFDPLTPPDSPTQKKSKRLPRTSTRLFSFSKPVRLRWTLVILLSFAAGMMLVLSDVLGRRRVGSWYTGTASKWALGGREGGVVRDHDVGGGLHLRVGSKVEGERLLRAEQENSVSSDVVAHRMDSPVPTTVQTTVQTPAKDGVGVIATKPDTIILNAADSNSTLAPPESVKPQVALVKESRVRTNSSAYVTLLCDDVMLESTLVLARSLNLSETRYPFIVLTLPSVSEAARVKLLTPGVGVQEVVTVSQLKYPFPVNDAKRAINKMCRYSKLQLWNMTQYDKIVFLDADMLVVKNIDDLFEWPEFSAVLDVGGVFNTGVFVAEPSNDTYQDMLARYRKAPSYNRGDQGFLNWYFNRRRSTDTETKGSPIHVLPPAYNTPIKLKEYAIWPDTKAAARVFHFTSETKPWSFWWTKHRHWQRNFDSGLFWKWIKVRNALYRDVFGIDPTNPIPSTKPWRNADRTQTICNAVQPYYSHFPIYEKYSVLVGTWDRIDILIKMIDHYRSSELIHTIFITWHNPNAPIPDLLQQAAEPQSGPKVEFLPQTTDSLNNRFNPIRRLKTRAVFIADEDIRVPIEDIDLAFKVWRSNPDSLIGFFPRTHKIAHSHRKNKYLASPTRYEYTHRDRASRHTYSMVLTKAMFAHSDFLFTYTCLLPPEIHAYIDNLNNCEDIAFNMMVTGMTGGAPVSVRSDIDDFGIKKGISTQGGHWGERSRCLNELVRFFGGGMTLRYNDVVVGRWEKTEWRERTLDEW
ncbi:Exostoses (Multiple)-like 3 [Rhizophlyctis rosea]|nr:Exostoses (Multiple)-like 3 [Rhizophlyctis rosea]